MLWRSRNVWVLSLASFLNDVASEMVMPLLPLFLAGMTGSGALALGLIEGLAELVSSALKWWMGRVTDKTGRTRPFVIAGYSLTALARPLLAVAQAPLHVLAVRLTDRVGKGVRTAPRDALLAASVPEAQRGAVFGLHKSMDHAGATLGPLLAFGMLSGGTTDLRDIFAVAVLPGLLAALVVCGSQELAPAEPPIPASGPAPTGLWRALLPVGLATLGTASDTFLMLKAGVDDQAPVTALPLLWMALHLVRTASAAPGGWLSDRLGARGIITVGWAIRGLVFLLLAVAPDLTWTAAAVVLYGLAGVADGAEKQLVAKLAPQEGRGAAFGSFHAVVGAAALPASLGFGALWEGFGPEIAFGTSSALVGSAILLLWALLFRRV